MHVWADKDSLKYEISKAIRISLFSKQQIALLFLVIKENLGKCEQFW